MKILMMPFKRAGLFIVLIFLTSSLQFAQVKGGRWVFENNGNDTAQWDEVDNIGVLDGDAFFKDTGTIIQGNYYLSIEDSANYGDFKVPDQEELDFLDENFAVSLWYYTVPAYDSPQYLLMKGDRSGVVKQNNYALRINKEKIEFIVHSESGSKKAVTSSFSAVENQWNFIGVFYNYDKSKIYLWNDAQSAPADSFDFNAPLFPNNDKLYIGSSGENGYKRFWGRIDDLRISNKISDIIDNATSVEHKEPNIHSMKFTLNQNYPNPFNPVTIIKFSLSEINFTKLDVYNVIGEHIASLVNRELPVGEHIISFNANNLPSGIYFYKLQQSNHSDFKKMILLK